MAAGEGQFLLLGGPGDVDCIAHCVDERHALELLRKEAERTHAEEANFSILVKEGVP